MTEAAGYDVLLGTLGKTFQLEGGVRFYALGEAEKRAMAVLERVSLEGIGERTLARVRPVGSHLIVYFVGEDTPEKAKRLVNADVYAPAGALPESEVHYLDLLLELPVYLDAELIGTVRDVIPAGSELGQDVLVVDAPQGEVLVPLQTDYVTLSEGRVTLSDPPEGLLELNS